MKKIKKPEYIKLEIYSYQGKIKEINFIFDISICYNVDTGKMYFDVNPYSEPELVEVIGITENHHDTTLTLVFETIDGRTVILEGDNDLEFAILRNILCVYHDGVSIFGECDERFSLIFHEGYFNELHITKWSGNNIEDSILLDGDDDVVHLIKRSPWKRIPISKIDIQDYSIFVYAGDEVISYNMSVIPLVKDLLSIMKKNINNKK